MTPSIRRPFLFSATLILLLAAFCYQRGSERLHNWLINHPRFGPAIRDWRKHGVISRTAKRNAMIALVAVLGLSMLLAVKPWIIAIPFVVLSLVAAFILSRPSVPRDGP